MTGFITSGTVRGCLDPVTCNFELLEKEGGREKIVRNR
jgi:hypothetical protein